jgi:hypothetical protein
MAIDLGPVVSLHAAETFPAFRLFHNYAFRVRSTGTPPYGRYCDKMMNEIVVEEASTLPYFPFIMEIKNLR